jgi:hypothetical protein
VCWRGLGAARASRDDAHPGKSGFGAWPRVTATQPHRLLGVDIYSFDFKISHIARHIRLPETPPAGPAALARPPERRVPSLLIINVQLPMYPVRPSFLGRDHQAPHAVRTLKRALLGRKGASEVGVVRPPARVAGCNSYVWRGRKAVLHAPQQHHPDPRRACLG